MSDEQRHLEKKEGNKTDSFRLNAYSATKNVYNQQSRPVLMIHWWYVLFILCSPQSNRTTKDSNSLFNSNTFNLKLLKFKTSILLAPLSIFWAVCGLYDNNGSTLLLRNELRGVAPGPSGLLPARWPKLFIAANCCVHTWDVLWDCASRLRRATRSLNGGEDYWYSHDIHHTAHFCRMVLEGVLGCARYIAVGFHAKQPWSNFVDGLRSTNCGHWAVGM